MLDQRLIIVVNRNWRIIKCCHYVFLHIANLCSLVLHTVHYKLDMAAIQLHKSAFHYVNRLFIPGYSDKLLITAQHIQDTDGSKAKSVTITVTAPTVFTLPSALKVIEEEAFEGVTVDKVVIPAGTTTIGSRAFADSSLIYIVIPDSVTSIASDAFDGVSGLTIQCSEGSAADTFAEAKGYSTVR